jgi:hypothetical protein
MHIWSATRFKEETAKLSVDQLLQYAEFFASMSEQYSFEDDTKSTEAKAGLAGAVAGCLLYIAELKSPCAAGDYDGTGI